MVTKKDLERKIAKKKKTTKLPVERKKNSIEKILNSGLSVDETFKKLSKHTTHKPYNSSDLRDYLRWLDMSNLRHYSKLEDGVVHYAENKDSFGMPKNQLDVTRIYAIARVHDGFTDDLWLVLNPISHVEYR